MSARSDVSPGAKADLLIYDMLNGHHSAEHEHINSISYGALVFTNSNRGSGARGAATPETEALLLLAPGVTGPKELKSSDVEVDGIKTVDTSIDEGIVCRTARLTAGPSLNPTRAPSNRPTISMTPTTHPTEGPPTFDPTPFPTYEPTREETDEPTTILP